MEVDEVFEIGDDVFVENLLPQFVAVMHKSLLEHFTNRFLQFVQNSHRVLDFRIYLYLSLPR